VSTPIARTIIVSRSIGGVLAFQLFRITFTAS